MYNHAPKNYKCPFCILVKREDNGITNADDIIYQDKFITAFISGKWLIKNPGHVLIIPNKHFENLYDIDEKYLDKIHRFSKKVVIAFKKVYKSDATSVRQHNEPDGNQDIFHYHLHVFPRYKNDNLYLNHKKTKWPKNTERKPYADKLRKYFKSSKILNT